MTTSLFSPFIHLIFFPFISYIIGTTGQSVAVTCNAGYAGSGTATCGTNGQFNTISCTANTCTPAGNVTNSNKASAGSITGTTGQTVTVTCKLGYSGTGTTICQTNGAFSSVPTCDECVLGKYNDEPGQPLCKDDCNAGSYILPDKSNCLNCPFGQWQNLDDQSSCKKCIQGKVLRKLGQKSDLCTPCAAGSYNPYNGHTGDCLLCLTAIVNGSSYCEGW